MTPEQIIKTAEDCGFTRTHTGEVQLWLCNKTDLANFMHVISEEAYHRGVQNGVVAGANNEREACESIEYDLAKSPAMFVTMAEYKAYKDGVQDYRTRIIARGEA